MTLPDVPLPPELAIDEEPLDEDDLAAYFEYVDQHEGAVGSLDEAVERPDQYAAHVLDAVPAHRWRVEADDQAEWALRRVAVAEEEVRRLQEQADEWTARITHWFEQASRRPSQTAAFFRDHLADYALRVREAGGPATIKLPGGEVKTSTRQPSVVVEDDEAVAAYVEAMLGAPTHALTDAEAVAWAAWQMAWSAACAGMDEPLEVVKHTAKVYVGPLRKLVAVGKVSEGVWATSTLACGHHVDRQAADLYDPDVPSRGDMLPCLACPLDLLDQAPPYVAVEVTIVEERFRQVVVGPDGSEVPGAGVDPGGVNVTVKAR